MNGTTLTNRKVWTPGSRDLRTRLAGHLATSVPTFPIDETYRTWDQNTEALGHVIGAALAPALPYEQLPQVFFNQSQGWLIHPEEVEWCQTQQGFELKKYLERVPRFILSPQLQNRVGNGMNYRIEEFGICRCRFLRYMPQLLQMLNEIEGHRMTLGHQIMYLAAANRENNYYFLGHGNAADHPNTRAHFDPHANDKGGAWRVEEFSRDHQIRYPYACLVLGLSSDYIG
jgi:hypothetical protein